MASNSAFFDAFFPNVVANATVPSGSFSEDVAAAFVFVAADATNEKKTVGTEYFFLKNCYIIFTTTRCDGTARCYGLPSLVYFYE